MAAAANADLRHPPLPRRSPSATPAMLPATHQSRPFRPNPTRRRGRPERKAGDAAPAKAPELVMGKVTILKRGEAPPRLPAPAAAAPPARNTPAGASYAGANLILSPSPVDVPMPIGLLRNLIISH